MSCTKRVQDRTWINEKRLSKSYLKAVLICDPLGLLRQ